MPLPLAAIVVFLVQLAGQSRLWGSGLGDPMGISKLQTFMVILAVVAAFVAGAGLILMWGLAPGGWVRALVILFVAVLSWISGAVIGHSRGVRVGYKRTFKLMHSVPPHGGGVSLVGGVHSTAPQESSPDLLQERRQARR